MLDLHQIKEDFSTLVQGAQPWTLAQFAMWLDLKLAEYKVYGYMVLDPEKTTIPRWLSDTEDQPSSIAPKPRLYQNGSTTPVVPSRNSSRSRHMRGDNPVSRDSVKPNKATTSSQSTNGTKLNSQGTDLIINEEYPENYNIYHSDNNSPMNIRPPKTVETKSQETIAVPSSGRQVEPPRGRISTNDAGNMVYIDNCESENVRSELRPQFQDESGDNSLSHRNLSPLVAVSSSTPQQTPSLPRERLAKSVAKISIKELIPSLIGKDRKGYRESNVNQSEGDHDDETMPLVINIKRSPSPTGYEDTEFHIEDRRPARNDAHKQGSPPSYVRNHSHPLTFSDPLYAVPSHPIVLTRYTLPTFNDPLIRKLLEDDVTRSRTVWTKVVQRCAYHLLELTGGQPQSRDYQGISEAFYSTYPGIGMKRGKHPWSAFAKSLSQRIRSLRLKNKKLEQRLQQYEQVSLLDDDPEDTLDISCYDDSMAASGSDH